jgi:hypothetical protein
MILKFPKDFYWEATTSAHPGIEDSAFEV